MKNLSDRQNVKISYWQFVENAETKVYSDGTREKRAIYLCTLCNRKFERSVRTDRGNRNQCCVSCARRRVNRKTWILTNIDTGKSIQVVNLKLWCANHGVCRFTLYKTHTQPNRNFARDKQGNRWKVRDVLS